MKSKSSGESLLTVFFLLLAVAAIVVYFVMPENRLLFYILGGIAVFIRIGQYLTRLFANIKMKKEKREKLLKDVPPVTMNRDEKK